MNLDQASTIISIIAAILGAYAVVMRWALASKEKEYERRLEKLEDAHERATQDWAREMNALREKVNIEEKATIRFDGDLRRIGDQHAALVEDIEKIDQRTQNIEKTTNAILVEMRGGPRYAPSRSEMQAVVPPSKKERY